MPLVSLYYFYFIAIGALRQECNSAPNLGGFCPSGEENTCNGGGQHDIVAVRHDLPHMPSLGVSSLDSRPPWQRGGLLFSPVPRHFAIFAPRSTVLQCNMRLAVP